jgi:hypothetical protein
MKRKKRLMKTSSALERAYKPLAEEKGPKKNPQPPHGRLGISPAYTLHSLILEDISVKNTRAGFLTLPTLTRLPIL